MLSIVGNIKISEPIRLKYLFATLKSYEFIKEYQLLLNIDTDIETFFKIDAFVRDIGFKNFELSNLTGNYGEIYCSMLDKINSNTNIFVLNFFEDHFLLLNDKKKLITILYDMHMHNVDVCKSSFWQIEQNSKTTIFKIQKENCIFLNDLSNFNQYQKYYGSRYYIGCNFITTLEFSKRFWNRKFDSKRPHNWEISKFSMEFLHTCMIPDVEIMCSIDDEHGEIGSCLIGSTHKKFIDIYNEL